MTYTNPAGASTAEPPVRGGANRKDARRALFGRLRDLRARAQNLLLLIVELQADRARFTDPTVRDTEMKAAFARSSPVAADDIDEIEARLGEAKALLVANDKLYGDWGDVLAQIASEWKGVTESWRLASQALNGSEDDFAAAAAGLKKVIYACGLVTIPARVRTHLRLLRIGGVLDFAAAYADELDTPADRKRFLEYLQWYPNFVDGLIEPENERILRADPRLWRRLASLGGAALIALAGFGLVYLACLFGDISHPSGWPFSGSRLEDLLHGYAFLLLGALAHVVINLLKQDRVASRSVQSLPDWIMRIHVRETSFFISALALAVGPVVMGFMFSSIDWKTAFFLGYSYDSFVDLFLQRFAKAVPNVADLQQQTSSQGGK